MRKKISWVTRLRLKLIEWLAGDLWVILNVTFTYDDGAYLLTRVNNTPIHTRGVEVACLVDPGETPPDLMPVPIKKA